MTNFDRAWSVAKHAEPLRGVKSAFDVAWGVVKEDRRAIMDEFNANAKKFARMTVDGPINMYDAFSGGGAHPHIEAGWNQGFRERGHNVSTIELDETLGYKPDFKNILDLDANDLIEHLNGEPVHVFCGSWPCEGFSNAGATAANWGDWEGPDEKAAHKKRDFNVARHNQDHAFFDDPSVGPTPTHERSHMGRKLANKFLEIKDDLLRDNPDLLWVGENPTNALTRYMPELGRERLMQPLPYDLSRYKYPDIEGVKRPRLARRKTEPPIGSITHASYAGPFSGLLGGSSAPMPGHARLPPRKSTDLWGNLEGKGGFELRPPTVVGVHPGFDRATYEAPTSYYKEGRTWPPRSFGHGGLFHSPAERGAKTGGIQGQGDWTHPSGQVIPEYWMRSLIPAELGRDVARAAEKWYGSQPSSTKGRR